MTKSSFGRRDFLTGSARAALGVGAAALVGASVREALAQAFPERELTWLIYQAPGGSIDVTSRAIQPFVAAEGIKTNLDYAVGAGGRIARNRLYRARPDGYTIMTESSPGAVMDEVLGGAEYKSLAFEPIYGWTIVGWQFCVKKDSSIRTFKDFVEETKKRRVVVGTIGRGGSSHFQLMLTKKELGLNFDVAHFDGSGKGYPAVMGGHIDVLVSGPGSGSRNRENLHFLGLTRPEKALADVPTIQSQGYNITSADQIWFAHTTPGVPADRLKILEDAFARAFAKAELRERMEKAGEFITLMNRAELQAHVAKHHKLITENKQAMQES